MTPHKLDCKDYYKLSYRTSKTTIVIPEEFTKTNVFILINSLV